MRRILPPTVITVAVLLAFRGASQGPLDGLLADLLQKPLNRTALYAIEAQPADPRILPALRAAFDSHDDKQERQWIAIALLHLGDRSDRYFPFLADYAKTAIDDHTPFFQRYDQGGKAIRGQFSVEFENWCALNHKDAREVAAVQFLAYPPDVMLLAEAEDPRATDLFRRGLQSANPLVVAYSVQGLGRLQDVSEIPSISKAADRLQAGDRKVVAMQLPWYARPEAYQLMARLDPDPNSRKHQIAQVEQLRALEAQRVLRRTGRSASK